MSRLRQLLLLIPLLTLAEIPAANGMYDPHLGRFCSKDPIGFEGSKWNMFEFLESNTLRNMDPSGTMTMSECNRRQGICMQAAADQFAKCYQRAEALDWGSKAAIAICYWRHQQAVNLCHASWMACIGKLGLQKCKKPAIVCAGAVVVVGGALVCCADTPLPGPADVPGGAAIACGCGMISCQLETEELE